MIHYKEFTLDNGLQVIHHPDTSTPLVAINILYNVGSRDENPEHTGLAHLFEHLMFSGSVNIPNYDTPLQQAGGSNNAFTNTDITNYYITLPAENMETAFWLESDRMLSLLFNQKNLDVQKGVVIEEFKKRYLNQPYGDIWFKLREALFKTHPYSWPTIGKSIEHVEKTNLDDIKSFFKRFYNPSNAILCVAGNVQLERVKELCNKWFAPISGGPKNTNHYPVEPPQKEYQTLQHSASVPNHKLIWAFRNVARNHPHYYTSDLLTDMLARSESSILHNEWVRKHKLCSQVNAYVTGELDPGILVVEADLNPNIDPMHAQEIMWKTLQNIEPFLTSTELTKVKNKAQTSYLFSLTQILNVAMTLSIYKNQGDIELINKEPGLIQNIQIQDVIDYCKTYIQRNNTTFFHNEPKLNP